jgi:hypothetical protein
MDKTRIRRKINEDLRQWFDKDHPKGGWKRYNTKGEAIGDCARKDGESTPKCLSNEKAAKMTKKERASAVKRKRKKDPVADKRGKGNKPKMVSNRIKENHMKTKNLEIGMSIIINESIHFIDKINRISDTFYKIQTITSTGRRDKDFLQYNEEIEIYTPSEDLAEEKNKGKKLNKPVRTPGGPKKFSVYVKNEKGNVVKVNFGDPNMEIKRDSAKRRKSFRARHNCESPGPKTKARYWSCFQWRKSSPVADSVEHTGDLINEKDCGCTEKKRKKLNEGKNKPTNPSLWSKAKSLAKKKFDVYPSAYANGWASKWYKKRGGKWKTVSESIDMGLVKKTSSKLENSGVFSGQDKKTKKVRNRIAQIIIASQ